MPFVRIPQAGAIGVNRDLSALPMRWLKLVVFGFCLAVRAICLFCIIKKPKVNMLPHVRQMRPPFSAQLMPIYADVARRVIRLATHVLMILKMHALSKIGDSVICGVAIDVVKLMIWECAIKVEPREAMRQNFATEDTDFYVSIRLWFSSSCAYKLPNPVLLPGKNPVIRVVMQRLQEALSVNVFHAKSPFIGHLRAMWHGSRHGNRFSGATLAMQGAE